MRLKTWMAVKYGRSYYKWFADNTLYFNNETGLWDSEKVYGEHFEKIVTDGFWFTILGYLDYILPLILVFFLYSVFINNKRVKDSVKSQREAISSIDITMAQQNKAMELHEQTNQILLDILNELKARKD